MTSVRTYIQFCTRQLFVIAVWLLVWIARKLACTHCCVPHHRPLFHGQRFNTGPCQLGVSRSSVRVFGGCVIAVVVIADHRPHPVIACVAVCSCCFRVARSGSLKVLRPCGLWDIEPKSIRELQRRWRGRPPLSAKASSELAQQVQLGGAAAAAAAAAAASGRKRFAAWPRWRTGGLAVHFAGPCRRRYPPGGGCTPAAVVIAAAAAAQSRCTRGGGGGGGGGGSISRDRRALPLLFFGCFCITCAAGFDPTYPVVATGRAADGRAEAADVEPCIMTSSADARLSKRRA